jgi:hypothetical protein
MLFREVVAVYFKKHTKHVSKICQENTEILMLKKNYNSTKDLFVSEGIKNPYA